MEMGLDGKVAIVTGGSEGIGKAAAERMAGEGANVIIVARRQDVLDAAADEIRTATEGEVLPLSADVTDKGTAARVVNTAVERYGRVDILVNNAGTSMAKGFEDVSDDDWELDFELKGVGRGPPHTGVHSRDAKGGWWPHHQCHQPGRPDTGRQLHAHVHFPSGWYRHHQGAVQGPGQRQHTRQHRVHRPHQERPAPAPLRCPHRERAGSGYGRPSTHSWQPDAGCLWAASARAPRPAT